MASLQLDFDQLEEVDRCIHAKICGPKALFVSQLLRIHPALKEEAVDPNIPR